MQKQNQKRIFRNWQNTAPAIFAVVLGACAQTTATVSPENINPVFVNHIPYMGYPCARLEENQRAITQELDATSQQKTSERTGPAIARLKGESEAVKRAMAEKRCSQNAAPDKKRAS